MITKPRIIAGICEYCGVAAVTCPHSAAEVVEKEVEIFIAPTVNNKKLNPLSDKKADIIIAHWNRLDLLTKTLECLPTEGFNTVVVRGHTYSIANNLGAKAAITDNLIFCNDDMIVPPATLDEMIESKADFCMAQQFYPDGKPQFCGLKWADNDFQVVFDPREGDVPTAACYRIKRKAFEALGGFNEVFINGGEDHELFFKALAAGYTFEFADTPVLHFSSSSEGRFDYEAKNIEILKKLWPTEKLAKLFYELKKPKEKRAQVKS